jgi:PAS domain S-box-containing protein
MSPLTANHSHRTPPVAASDLTGFLDSAPIAIHNLDANGTIVWANRAELELLGYSADEYVGQPIARFHVDPDDPVDMLAQLARGETLRDREVRLRARDGSIRHMLISANRIDGERSPARCFVRDITEQKRCEHHRARLIDDLTRTVRLSDMFAGIVGHDLRGPLSTIVMAGQLLLGYVDEPKAVRTIDRMLNAADRMQQMISQLLDFARARADGGIELERRPSELAEIARNVIEEIRLARPEARIELEIRGDACGELDNNRLSQVFANLIGNAVQHGSLDAPIAVAIDGSQPDAIRVAVRNRGTISRELLPVLFAPFRGSQQKALRSHGLGLGLFITDHIVRAHGGAIAAESSDGTTVFRFDVPRHANGAAQVATFDHNAVAAPAAANDQAHGHRENNRRHEERFRILIDSIKDYAIFMLDADGHVATWNLGAQRIKGYTAPEIIGRHFSVFYPEADVRAGKCEMELEGASRDGRFEDEGWRLRKDGSRFWANVVITALRGRDGTLLGYAKVTRDLTERRELEEERIRLARAQEAVRLRDEFLSLASHELKTPLTVLQLQLEALQERLTGDHTTTGVKLDRSQRAMHRLSELIEALLDVSRIATGQFTLHLEPGDLGDIVATAVDRMHETAAAAGCALSVTTLRALGTWDRSRIDQVVTNLVSNAVRYAAGTPIEVSVTRDGAAAVIEVRDCGPGLPTGKLSQIFERFERGVSMRHFGGLGLGLYVVQQITQAHGGDVTAENRSGGGACFTVRLPLRASSNDLVA